MKAARKITAGALLLAAAGCKNDTPSAPELSSTVSVSGKAQVGETLTAVASLGRSGAVSYQWVRGAANIPGATDETYTLTEADAGKTIRVRASRAGYAGSVSSEPTEAVAPAPEAFTSIPDLQAYLETHSGGADADAPVPVKLSADLSGTNLSALFAALKDADRYVGLDLSGCTGLSAWARYTDASTEKIVSLALPDTVTRTPGGSLSAVIFGSFAALKTLEASSLQTVGACAFYNCAALETVSLPAAADIGSRAFSNCAALKTVNLPAAITIGKNAFAGCTALETVSLPAAADIGEWAFFTCPALKTISLPNVATIGDIAFRDCTALESLTLGTALPTIGTSYVFLNDGKNNEKGFTIYVPTSEAKTALEAAIKDESSNWHKGLTTNIGIGAGKFMGVKLTQ